MYLRAEVYTLMDHELVRLVLVPESTDPGVTCLPPAMTREVYLPDSGDIGLDRLQALAWGLGEILEQIVKDPREVEPYDQVTDQAVVVMDDSGRLRVAQRSTFLGSFEDSPQ